MPDTPGGTPRVYEVLSARLAGIEEALRELTAFGTKAHAGTGSRWELTGYADILSDAIKRVEAHHKRVEGVDRQIARELNDQ